MHVSGAVPGCHHIALVAQRLGELIQCLAVGIADLVDEIGLLVRIGLLGRGVLVVMGFLQRFESRLEGLFRGFVRLLGTLRAGCVDYGLAPCSMAADSAHPAAARISLTVRISLTTGARRRHTGARQCQHYKAEDENSTHFALRARTRISAILDSCAWILSF